MMVAETPAEIIPTKQTRKQFAPRLKEILGGISLSVGMNSILTIVGSVLLQLIWAIDARFFASTPYSYLRGIGEIGIVAFIFLINIAVFIWLIVKRPLMAVSMLVGIPILVGLIIGALIFLWFLVVLLLFIGWLILGLFTVLFIWLK